MRDLVRQETDRIYNRFLDSVTDKVFERLGLQNTKKSTPYMSMADKHIQDWLKGHNRQGIKGSGGHTAKRLTGTRILKNPKKIKRLFKR